MNEENMKQVISEDELKGVSGGSDVTGVDYSVCSTPATEAECLQYYQCKWLDKKCQAASIERLGGVKDAIKWG